MSLFFFSLHSQLYSLVPKKGKGGRREGKGGREEGGKERISKHIILFHCIRLDYVFIINIRAY